MHDQGADGAVSAEKLAAAYESLLAAEGSDWCWWYGPEHSTYNDAEFDAFYRTLLTEVYLKINVEPPGELAEPIKRLPEDALVSPPQSFLNVRVDGRESTYFEWLGAGLYAADRRGGSMHGRAYLMHELHYGFDDEWLYVRVDLFEEAKAELRDCVFRVAVRAAQELKIQAHIHDGMLTDLQVGNERSVFIGRAAIRASFVRPYPGGGDRAKRNRNRGPLLDSPGNFPLGRRPACGHASVRRLARNQTWRRSFRLAKIIGADAVKLPRCNAIAFLPIKRKFLNPVIASIDEQELVAVEKLQLHLNHSAIHVAVQN